MIDAGLLLWIVDIGGFLAAWAIVWLLVKLAPKIGLLDRPNERSSHTKVTPRGGGLGFVILVALMLGLVLAWIGVVFTETPGWNLFSALAAYLGSALFVAVISLRDDFKSLGAGIRLLCQISAAVVAVSFIDHFRCLSFFGFDRLELGWAGWGLTVVWIVGMTNVYNFMDGIDGIAGVQGAVAGLAWAMAGAWMSSPLVAMLGLMLAGGCAGFLVHNWPPAEIFMGDVGSAFLGFSFAVIPLIALRFMPPPQVSRVEAAMPLFALVVMWPFVGDGFLTFLRRLRKGEKVWLPHRSHLYQRLVRNGWSHAKVSSLYGLWCILSAQIALNYLKGNFAAWLLYAYLAGSLLAMFLLVRWQETVFSKRAQ